MLLIMLAPVKTLFLCTASVLFIVSTQVNGQCLLGADEVEATSPFTESGQYLSLIHPAQCDGNLTAWHFCYYTSNLERGRTYTAYFRVWRPQIEGIFERVHEYIRELVADAQLIMNNGDASLVCENVTLNEENYFEVHQLDVLGVYLPSLSRPLRIIGDNIGGFGLSHDTRRAVDAFPSETIRIENLEVVANLGLHLYADIDGKVWPTTVMQPQLTLQPSPISPSPSRPSSLPLQLQSVASTVLQMTSFVSSNHLSSAEHATTRMQTPLPIPILPTPSMSSSEGTQTPAGRHTTTEPLARAVSSNIPLPEVGNEPTVSMVAGNMEDKSSPSNELGAGILAAIAVASVVTVIVTIGILTVLFIILCKKCRRKRTTTEKELVNGRNNLFYFDNVVYSGAVAEHIPLNPTPKESNVYETQVNALPLNQPQVPQPNGSIPQPYEVPAQLYSSYSANSTKLLAVDIKLEVSQESQYITMESDLGIVERYSPTKQVVEERQKNGRNSRGNSVALSELYSSLRMSADYYRLLEQATEGTEHGDQYYAPPSSEAEILETLSKQGILMVPRKEIQLTSYLGSGQFGNVEKATWTSHQETIRVAVKSLTVESSEVDKVKLLQEAAIMGQFRHPNVVRLHGVVMEGNTLLLVLEYLPKGDLRRCLVNLGHNVLPPDTPQLLLSYLQQVALGMHYLSNKGFVHRDLAARNVFMTNDDVCKVGDFGMSRDLADAEYYLSHGGKIPVRWTAPEAMYYRKYSTASDVWSYGCLLYEIWSLGRMPFRNYTNTQVIEKVDSGYRLPPPPGCPRVIYEIMIKCWHPRPASRPTFKELLLALLQDEGTVLHIPVSDASTHKQAPFLGSELQAGEFMYTELQQMYQICTSNSEYDHIAERKYLSAFPTSSADIESMYDDSVQPAEQQQQQQQPLQSYRWTLLTSDTESDYEDIGD